MNEEIRAKLRELLEVLDRADALATELVPIGLDARGAITDAMIAVSRVMPEDIAEEFDEVFAGAEQR